MQSMVINHEFYNLLMSIRRFHRFWSYFLKELCSSHKPIVTILTMCLLLGYSPVLQCSEIKVALEPLPPFVKHNKSGLTIDLLKAVEQHTDLTFNIYVLPYNRAKRYLKAGNIELMGHTPYGVETQEFYSYAIELDWFIKTTTDIYSMDAKNLADDVYKTLLRVGTPRGNEAFFSELYNIPINQFVHHGDLENLLRMLKGGRLDLFMFERSSTMHVIKSLKLKGIQYRKIDAIPIGLAVRKDLKGFKLKKQLESAFKKVDQEAIFSSFVKYNDLPDKGEVSLD